MNRKLTRILAGMAAGVALYFAPAPAANAQEIEANSTAGKVFLQKCTPGESYLLQTETKNSIELVCPEISKKKQKGVCESQFEGNGFCGEKNLANALGLDKNTYVKRFCPDNSYCFDASKITLKGEVKDLNGKVVDLEGRVNEMGGKVDALEQDKLNDVERFAVALAEKQCQPDYDRFNAEITDYKNKVNELRKAEKAIKDYTASLSIPTSDDKLTPRNLLTTELRAEKSVIDRETAINLHKKVEEAETAVQKAEKNVLDDKKNLEELGCGYQSRTLVPEERKSEIVALSLLGSVDFKGNPGGMLEAGMLFPLSEIFSAGVYLNGSFLKQENEKDYAVDYGTATGQVNEKTESNRYLGGGLRLSLNPATWLELYAKAGTAWTTEKNSKEITILNDTKTIRDSKDQLVPEWAVGAEVKVYKSVSLTGECGVNTTTGPSCSAGVKIEL